MSATSIEAKVSALVSRAMHESTGEEEARTSAMMALKLMTKNGGRIVFGVQSSSNPSPNQSHNASGRDPSQAWDDFEKEIKKRQKQAQEKAAFNREQELKAQREREQQEIKAQQERAERFRKEQAEKNKNTRRKIFNKFPGYCVSCRMACGKGTEVYHSWQQKNIQCDYCYHSGTPT